MNSSSVYVVLRRQGIGLPEMFWFGPFKSVSVNDEGSIVDSRGDPVAHQKEPGWYYADGDDDSISYRLSIEPLKPEPIR